MVHINHEIILILNKKIPIELIKNIFLYINKSISDKNFRDAIDLWFFDEKECIKIYGHISNWNTINITDMSSSFSFRTNFN